MSVNFPDLGNTSWRLLAKNDLKAIRQTLKENHPGICDTVNQDFLNWFNYGNMIVLAMADQIISYKGYYYCLKFYINGFLDNHLKIQLPKHQNPLWPGFLVKYRGGDLVVAYVDEKDTNFTNLPPINAKLCYCDHIKPEAYMKKNIFAYDGNVNLESSWYNWGPYILVNNRNPWRKEIENCLFEIDGKSLSIELKWQYIDERCLADIITNILFGNCQGSYWVSEFEKNAVWIRLPSFQPKNRTELTEIYHIINILPELRRKEIIVFDVRGNRGGNSQWGLNILNQLYGEEYVNYKIYSNNDPARKQSYVEWRVSKGNIDYLANELVSIKNNFGEDSLAYCLTNNVVSGMKDAFEKEEPLYRETKIFLKNPGSIIPISLCKSKIFLLTDSRCASACLTFADLLFELGGVIHIGQSTNADSVYMDTRSVLLPSGISKLIFPMKVYRNRKRGNNQAHVPKYKWDGEIGDTEKIKDWVIVNKGKLI
jgi:hypothetical protein